MKEAESSKEAVSLSCTPLGRGRYKIWALLVILLLAFWSVLSGTAGIARNRPAGDPASSDVPSEQEEDSADVLEMDAREKLVIHMWDKYRHNPRLKLRTFWQDAFEAAYEELESEVPSIKQSAITEIAKLSLIVFDVENPLK